MGRVIGVIYNGKYYSLSTTDGRDSYQAAVRESITKRSDLPCPAIHTDTNFFKGDPDGFQHNQRLREIYHTNARKAGIDTTGKCYVPQLVRRGMACGRDPEAWVPLTTGRSYIKKILEKRGWESEGRIEVKGRPHDVPDDDDRPYEPAKDVIDKAVALDILRLGIKNPSQNTIKALREENKRLLVGNKNDK